MTYSTKWYATKTGIVMGSGSTLTIASGATLSAAAYSQAAPASLAVTNAMTVGTTLGVAGDFAVATNKFQVTAASGNTTVAGTLDVTSDFRVNTTYFTATAASGNVVAKGTANLQGAVTVGVAAAANAIVIDPAGAKATPAASEVQLFFDGTDLKATNSAGKNVNITNGGWA